MIPESPRPNEGSIQLSSSAVPTDVACVRLTVANAVRTVVRDFDATPGQALTASLSGLPTGMVSVSAEAFAATCPATGAPTTWISEPLTATLVAGIPLPVQLTMQHNGRIALSIDWENDAEAPRCGNGIVDPGEQCDDGNLVNGDGCEANCTLPACGNGILDPREQCDNGASDTAVCNGDQAGAVSCLLATCGDGHVNGAFTPSGSTTVEECDNPGGGDTLTCNGNNGGMNGPGSCRHPACGDGYTNLAAGEQCDTLGGPDSPLCNGSNAGAAGCQPARCGDGYVNFAASERCDNLGGTDSVLCNGTSAGAAGCQPARCGDGYVNVAASEQCDTLGGADTAGCNGRNAGFVGCRVSLCGDGYANLAAGERCDSGGADSPVCNGPSAGTARCQPARCGDGYVNLAAGELCERDADCPPSRVCSACRCQ